MSLKGFVLGAIVVDKAELAYFGSVLIKRNPHGVALMQFEWLEDRRDVLKIVLSPPIFLQGPPIVEAREWHAGVLSCTHLNMLRHVRGGIVVFDLDDSLFSRKVSDFTF